MPLVSCFTGTALLAIVSFASAYVQIPVVRNEPGNPPLMRRGAFEQIMLNNLTGGGYYAEVGLGTPRQNVTLVVDTGSSDVWVLDKAADLCTSPEKQQENFGGCIQTCKLLAPVVVIVVVGE